MYYIRFCDVHSSTSLLEGAYVFIESNISTKQLILTILKNILFIGIFFDS